MVGYVLVGMSARTGFPSSWNRRTLTRPGFSQSCGCVRYGCDGKPTGAHTYFMAELHVQFLRCIGDVLAVGEQHGFAVGNAAASMTVPAFGVHIDGIDASPVLVRSIFFPIHDDVGRRGRPGGSSALHLLHHLLHHLHLSWRHSILATARRRHIGQRELLLDLMYHIHLYRRQTPPP